MSIITYGMGVHWATAVQQETGADIEIIDLRTLVPLDTEAVLMSAKKTGPTIRARASPKVMPLSRGSSMEGRLTGRKLQELFPGFVLGRFHHAWELVLAAHPTVGLHELVEAFAGDGLQ